MLNDDDHQLDALIRVVDPDKFSLKAHEPGYLLLFDAKEKQFVERTGLLRRLMPGKGNIVHYFVKQLDKPLVVKNWSFRWADGTSDVDLKLTGHYEIFVVNKVQAESLAKTLHRSTAPAKALHALIDRRQHEEVERIFRECEKCGYDLLDELQKPRQGLSKGASGHARLGLDEYVSQAVATDLGVRFTIGFELESMPPRQFQIDKHDTRFTVSDVSEDGHVLTSAHLQMNNYQNYKRSGLGDGEATKAQIRRFIDEAVQEFLFGKPYYTIARDFDRGLKPKIERYIRERAGKIGFEIKLFQTHPNIEVLCLAQPFRVDLVADKYEFRPRYSTGYVKMDVTVEVEAHDYTKLSRLIKPGKSRDEISALLESELAQICRDEIHRIDRKQFNLTFDASPNDSPSVVGALSSAFTRVLDDRYGLRVSVVNISQAQTEEGERFTNIRAKATPFTLHITSQADGGKRNKVQIDGKYEVVDIITSSWDKFESKDFGYRKDSVYWSPEKLAELSDSLRQRLPHFSESDFEKERKSQAVCNELREIAVRISSLLENAISKISDVANRSRSWEEISSLRIGAEEMARTHIADEFGVIIAFREFRRLDTLTERTEAELLVMEHDALLARAGKDISRSDELVDISHKGQLEYLDKLHKRKADQIDREPDEAQASEGTRIDGLIRDAVGAHDWSALPPASVKVVLHRKPSGGKKRLSLGDELKGIDTPPLRDDGHKRLEKN